MYYFRWKLKLSEFFLKWLKLFIIDLMSVVLLLLFINFEFESRKLYPNIHSYNISPIYLPFFYRLFWSINIWINHVSFIRVNKKKKNLIYKFNLKKIFFCIKICFNSIFFSLIFIIIYLIVYLFMYFLFSVKERIVELELN